MATLFFDSVVTDLASGQGETNEHSRLPLSAHFGEAFAAWVTCSADAVLSPVPEDRLHIAVFTSARFETVASFFQRLDVFRCQRIFLITDPVR